MPRTTSAPPPRRLRGGIAERKARALEEALDVRRLPGPYPRLEVRNPVHATCYTVLLPVFPDREVAMCTCADFARSGLGTCKHVEAADRWLRVHPEAVADPEPGVDEPAEGIWSAVMTDLAARPSDLSPARRMRWAGTALYRRRIAPKKR
ncbi:MAG: hypothetical protein ACREB9_00440 [Thermoplasmata archaeon]